MHDRATRHAIKRFSMTRRCFVSAFTVALILVCGCSDESKEDVTVEKNQAPESEQLPQKAEEKSGSKAGEDVRQKAEVAPTGTTAPNETEDILPVDPPVAKETKTEEKPLPTSQDLLASLSEAIDGFEVGDEAPLPDDFDVSRYLPQIPEGTWFLRGTLSYNLKNDARVAPMGNLLQTSFIRENKGGRLLVSRLGRVEEFADAMSIYSTEEFRVSQSDFVRTGSPSLSNGGSTIPLSPPEVKISGEKLIYYEDGIDGKRRVTLTPRGISTVRIGGTEYRGLLHMEETSEESPDTPNTTSFQVHSWWHPSIGEIANVFLTGIDKPCEDDDGCPLMVTLLLRHGKGHGFFDIRVRAGHLVPGTWEDDDAVKKRILNLVSGGGSQEFDRVEIRRMADDFRRLVFLLSEGCEDYKKNVVSLIKDGLSTDRQTARLYWEMWTFDQDPSGEAEIPQAIIKYKDQIMGGYMSAYQRLDDPAVPQPCLDALLDVGVQASNGCLLDGAPHKPEWILTSASKECGVPENTPATSSCGSSIAVKEARERANWFSWGCTAKTDAGDSWKNCLAKRDYSGDDGKGCPGKTKCCPPQNDILPLPTVPREGRIVDATRVSESGGGSESRDSLQKPVGNKDLCIDTFEVTNEAYDECIAAGKCEGQQWFACKYMEESPSKKVKATGLPGRPNWSGANHPVMCVSPNEAQRYCEQMGGRLPTIEEWVSAAGGNGRKYPWEGTIENATANGCDSSCVFPWHSSSYDDGFQRTAPVGSLRAGDSPLGVADLAGNVWEWVSDNGIPIAKGGGWNSNDSDLLVQTEYRNVTPDARWNSIGFRCVYDGRSKCAD